MRILFVTAAYLPQSIGGVELHVRALASALTKNGHQAAIFTRGADPAREEFSLERTSHEGVPVFRLDYKFSDCASFEGIVVNPRIRAAFEAVLDEWSPDVVHVHHLTCLSTDLIDAAKDRGIGVVMTLHDFWMGCPRGQRITPSLSTCETLEPEKCVPCLTAMWSGWFGVGRDGPSVPESERKRRDLDQLARYHAWIRDRLLLVDRLVTPSESSRRLFGRQGIPVEKITVVVNGLDSAAFDSIARPPRDARAPFRFGYLGSVIPSKGVHDLVAAFVELRRTRRERIELHVHGEIQSWHEVSGYEARLRELAAPAIGSIFFHGRYEIGAAPSILANLDALVVPSRWVEAFCLTLREGYLAGIPVIVADHGAMREGFARRDEALPFRPGDVDDLARQMTRLLEEPDLRDRLARAPKSVRSIDDNARELESIYQSLRRTSGAVESRVQGSRG